MPELTSLTPLELAGLLQAASDHELPGKHLTDPVFRYDLAFFHRQEALKLAVIAKRVENREAMEDDLMFWVDAEFMGVLGLPDKNND